LYETIKILKEPFYNFNTLNTNSVTKSNNSISVEYDIKLIHELNKIFEKNNIKNENLKLHYIDIVYDFFANRWNLYTTDKKQFYIKNVEEAYNFYKKYPAKDRKNIIGYKKILIRYFVQKYNLITLFYYFRTVVGFIFKKLGIWI
jgi:hypothetical protein